MVYVSVGDKFSRTYNGYMRVSYKLIKFFKHSCIYIACSTNCSTTCRINDYITFLKELLFLVFKNIICIRKKTSINIQLVPMIAFLCYNR